jgi:hypothetical protein
MIEGGMDLFLGSLRSSFGDGGEFAGCLLEGIFYFVGMDYWNVNIPLSDAD